MSTRSCRENAHGLVTDATLATAGFVGSAGTSLIRGTAKEAPHGVAEMQARSGDYLGFTDQLFQFDRMEIPPTGASTAIGRPFEADCATAS
jgi:hypothetical protein